MGAPQSPFPPTCFSSGFGNFDKILTYHHKKTKENEHDNNTIFSLGVYTAREAAADVSEVIFTCVSSELYFLHLFKDANTLGETESTGEQQNRHRDGGMSPGYVRYLTKYFTSLFDSLFF